MRSRTASFLYFSAIVAAVLALLAAANRLPRLFQADTLRAYDSIETLKAKLNLKDLAVPAYFPQTVSWPPALILGQTRPSLEVFMVFNRTGDGGPLLTIRQASFPDRAAGDPAIRLLTVREAVAWSLKQKTALLEVGPCEDGAECSRISWEENGRVFTVAMKAPPFEIVRIAESMIR